MTKVKMKKAVETNSCYNCEELGWRHYMAGPHNGGIDCHCKFSGEEINNPRDVLCGKWAIRAAKESK